MRLFHKIGWKYKKFRVWYYKLTGKWIWGIMGCLQTPECFPLEDKLDINDGFQNYMEKIFED